METILATPSLNRIVSRVSELESCDIELDPNPAPCSEILELAALVGETISELFSLSAVVRTLDHPSRTKPDTVMTGASQLRTDTPRIEGVLSSSSSNDNSQAVDSFTNDGNATPSSSKNHRILGPSPTIHDYQIGRAHV